MTLFKQSALAAAVCIALAPAAFAQQTSGSSTPAADAGSTTPSTGSAATPSSDEVRQVQQHLKEKGGDVGAIDGVMGPKTRSALKSFQQQQGLTASGEIDSSTLTALGVAGGGSTMDSSSPAGGAAPGATGGNSSTSPGGATGGSTSSPSGGATTPPSGGSTYPSNSGSSSGTMPKK
jgi:peptidoglycan hydrolase-like protein with peptidoglycan-binding domain